jgi:hypothetical protein
MLIRLPRLLFFWNLLILIVCISIFPIRDHSFFNDTLRSIVILTGAGAAMWILAAEIWDYLTH